MLHAQIRHRVHDVPADDHVPPFEQGHHNVVAFIVSTSVRSSVRKWKLFFWTYGSWFVDDPAMPFTMPYNVWDASVYNFIILCKLRENDSIRLKIVLISPKRFWELGDRYTYDSYTFEKHLSKMTNARVSDSGPNLSNIHVFTSFRWSSFTLFKDGCHSMARTTV